MGWIMICLRCSGSGQVLGNGLIIDDCKNCRGSGYVNDTINSTTNLSTCDIRIDKRSKAYRDAIKDLQKSSPELSLEQANKLFEKTFRERA